MADIHTLLRPLERLETTMAEIYENLASTHQSDAEASRLFARLAMEEQSHAAQVSYIRRLATQNAKAFSSVDIDLSEILKTLEDVATLQRNAAELPLALAVRTLLDIEQRAAEAHARGELALASESLARLLETLMKADRDHARSIGEFASRRGIISL